MTENSTNNTNPVQEPKVAQQQYKAPEPNIPSQYKPLSPWAYIGYSLLFSLPLVGFIMVLVFSFDSTNNINRRNYARSNLYMMIIALVFSILMFVIIFAILGVGFASFDLSSSSSSFSSL